MEGVEIRAALYTVHPGKLEKVLAVLKEHWPEWEEEGALALHQNSKILSKLEIENHKGEYGTALQAGNGRDMLQDAYEEVLDLAVYLRGCIEEQETK